MDPSGAKGFYIGKTRSDRKKETLVILPVIITVMSEQETQQRVDANTNHWQIRCQCAGHLFQLVIVDDS